MFSINPKKLIITIVCLIVAVMASDFLIHAVILGEDYGATESVWRPEAEMKAGYMMAGQILLAIAFAMLYARGFATGSLRCSIVFGVIMGAVAASTSLVYYGVLPITMTILVKWVVGGLAQGILFGVIARFAYGRGKVDPSAADQG